MRSRKLVWTEGLFVTQHHFQQVDRYHEALLQERFHAVMPYDWGVTDIEIDARALSAGQFRLSRLAAVLPNGTPIVCGENADDSPAPRSVEGAFAPQMKALDVYLALAQESETAPNVELNAKSNPVTRFVREQTAIFDVNTGTGELSIAWARRNVRFLFGDERRDAYDTIRIAQLVRSASGSVVVKETYVPPVLRMSASSFLVAGFGRLLSALTGKQRSLADTRRQRTSAAVEFQAADAAKFWLLNTLNQAIPSIAHLVDQGSATAEEAYLMLAQLIGQLCTFAVDGDPTTIPHFNYLDLGEVFDAMFTRVHALLEAVIAERYVEITLERRDDGMYLGKIDDPQVLRYEFFLAASGSVPEGQLRDRLPKLAKIASWTHISSILNSAVNGARIELEYSPPGALPVKPGLVFFRVHRTPEYWNDIQATGTIAIYQPLDPGALNLVLYAVDPSNLR